MEIPLSGEQSRRDALADFAARVVPWDYYATFTFRKDYKSHRAVQALLARGLDSLPLMMQPALVFGAAEPHKSGFFHVHALMANGGLKQPWRWWKEWAFKRFGIARVYRIDPKRGAEPIARYLTKYIVKYEEDDAWFLWGETWRLADGRETPRPVHELQGDARPV